MVVKQDGFLERFDVNIETLAQIKSFIEAVPEEERPNVFLMVILHFKLFLKRFNARSKEKMAGVPGFEPGIAIPKTAALPLGYTPIQKVLGRYRGNTPIDARGFVQKITKNSVLTASVTPRTIKPARIGQGKHHFFAKKSAKISIVDHVLYMFHGRDPFSFIRISVYHKVKFM